jgi:hypothetical protein
MGGWAASTPPTAFNAPRLLRGRAHQSYATRRTARAAVGNGGNIGFGPTHAKCAHQDLSAVARGRRCAAFHDPQRGARGARLAGRTRCALRSGRSCRPSWTCGPLRTCVAGRACRPCGSCRSGGAFRSCRSLRPRFSLRSGIARGPDIAGRPGGSGGAFRSSWPDRARGTRGALLALTGSQQKAG